MNQSFHSCFGVKPCYKSCQKIQASAYNLGGSPQRNCGNCSFAFSEETFMNLQAGSLKYFRLSCALVLLAVALFGTQARTQEVTAGITGTITDPSGSAVVDALVTATDTQRATTFSTKSNTDGIYYLQRIPVGTYTLRAESDGFRTETLAAFTLVLNQIARLDFHMALGSFKEVVEVPEEAPLLQTQGTEVSTIIDAETNVALPLASRNYLQVALLAPGAVTPNREAIASANRIDMAGQPYINGNREQDNNFLLDGMDNNQVSDNLVAYSPSPDAIQEFNLITQNASAEFGNFQGGIISVSLKSGTNQFHGDAWEFFRNDVLNANNWGHKITTPLVPRDKLRWNMFGGTVGGPILRNKLFFFFDYQGQRFDHPASSSLFTVFTAKERTGDFSELLQQKGIQLYDPCSAGTGVPGTPCTAPATRAAFANNQIPMNRIDPVAQALFNSSLYPAPINGSLQNNALNTTYNNFNSNQYDIKIDDNISGKDRLYGRYSHALQRNPTFNSFKLFGTGFSEAPIYSGVLNWTHTVTTNLLNEA